MAENSYGDWADWLLCLCIAITLLTGAFVNRFLARLSRLFDSLSPLRKAFGVLSLIAIPYMVSSGFGEQAAAPMNPQSPILWFTAAALNAIIFFWLCEELLTTKPLLRITFLAGVGIIIILTLLHQVKWVVEAANDAATKVEIEEVHNLKNDVLALKLYTKLTVPSAKPPAAINCPPSGSPKPRKESQLASAELPIQLSAIFYSPQAPSIVISNPFDHVAEHANFGMVLFRTSDLTFFSFSTQTIDYIKPLASSPPYIMNVTPAVSEGNAQLVDGDELTGSVSVDCPLCNIQTYIIHFVWKRSGWFYESEQKAGYVVPKDMSKDGRAKYIQFLTSDLFAKKRTEIVTKQP